MRGLTGLAVVLTVVAASGCAESHDIMMEEPGGDAPSNTTPALADKAAPTVEARHWYEHAAPSRPACRTIKGSYGQPTAVSICHTLYSEVRAYACEHDADERETRCANDTVVQWEDGGDATVFVAGEYDATLQSARNRNGAERSMLIEFANGSSGLCQISPWAVTLCIHAR